jgi:UDP-3-O-[3-hydroxymyristoyl] glucosamine N-acyltransferase
MTLHELAGRLGLDYRGESDTVVSGVRDIETLGPEADLEDGFVYFIETPAVLKRHPKAAERGVVLTGPALADRFPRALVTAKGKERIAFIALLDLFDRAPRFPAGISPQAVVDAGARVAKTAVVLPGAVVMEGAEVGEGSVLYPGVVLEPFAKVGARTVLFPNVVVGSRCLVGDRCRIHGGTVLGADGFGFHDDADGRHKLPQIGNVVIADHVEIGASCTVDRAAIESTTIGEHTKIDDQVHIGHNCRVGRYVYIVGNTAVGGSVVIGDGAMLSGMVIVKDHLKIAPGSIVMGLSGVAQDTEPKTAYFGAPARPARQMHKPELLKKVAALEAKIDSLEKVAA